MTKTKTPLLPARERGPNRLYVRVAAPDNHEHGFEDLGPYCFRDPRSARHWLDCQWGVRILDSWLFSDSDPEVAR